MNFWYKWQNQKESYKSIPTWWEIGKLYFKMLATQYCVQMQKNIRMKQTQLINLINMEKQKANPDQHKITNAHQHLEDIDNYKITGSIIQNKDKIILEQEKPNKYFFDQEKQKQKLKTIKQLQKNTSTNEMKTITTDYEKLTYCVKPFFLTFILKLNQTKQFKKNYYQSNLKLHMKKTKN